MQKENPPFSDKSYRIDFESNTKINSPSNNGHRPEKDRIKLLYIAF